MKAFDLAANPYLVVAALIFAGLGRLRDGATLPASIDVDPASLSEDERAGRGIVALPRRCRWSPTRSRPTRS